MAPVRTKAVVPTGRNAVRKMVRDIVESRIEHKVGTVTQAFATVTTTGTVDVVTQSISQGSDINNRDGDMIIVDELKLIFTVQGTGTAVAAPTQVRFILFADMLNVGSAPTVAEILNAVDYAAGILPVSRQKNRFRVYEDRVFDVVAGTAKSSITLDKTYKINRKCFYSGTTGSSSNGKGALFMLHLASNTGATVYQYRFGWELKYSDA